MKKILILLLTLSMIAAAFMGCAEKFGSSSKDTNGNGLRDDVELEILKAHHKKSGMDKYEKLRLDIHEVSFYGKYNDVYVVSISCGYAIKIPVEGTPTWSDSLLSYDDFGIIAWYDGELKSVNDLINMGILTEDNVMEIKNIWEERVGK